ncbi:disease resistance protein RUN1-like [Cornus florida]|uniref:disease resistance protein RUN1-like n=1 Tax=Cornus florida TaxID=4283 RepID=UPI0028999E92|nr:disease resistance protein RUN1-like [Cornus florida]
MASSSSSLCRSEYDVFLSFRGDDTRKSFVGHLYTALEQRGIRTFKDEERLEQGKSISLDLRKSINESSIAVIIFSKNYANSSWCLDELVEILECRRTKGLIVLPIFYDVKASQVRNQKGSFAKAFEQHEIKEMERVQRWRAHLKEAANLCGLDLEDAANGYEDKFIKRIVQVISEKLQPKPFEVADYEVGINARVDKIMSLLEEDQLFVGICGIGGTGKTTVAKAIFNRISKTFERSCFLENVREESTNHGGLAKLQSNFLREILMDKNITISYPDRGINEIKERLHNKRLLLVLDDVDKENILKYFVGKVGEEWFGNGSRIIITTREKWLLEKYNVGIYDIEVLNDSEALELFSWHAFKQNKPKEEYEKLSHHAKDYCKGLPLALQVLGSYFSKRSKQDCLTILNRLQTKPPKEIHEVLRISYEGLDKEEKDTFLDIACFFKGYNKKHVLDASKRSESDTAFGIQILRERCLINISKDNKLSMHDLIQEMGREIVRQESDDPGRRSRLWSYEDIYKVFTENTGTENIEGVVLPKKELSLEDVEEEERLHVSVDAFTKMRKLRILIISGVELHECPKYLSNELRYLNWSDYPAEHLPNNFHPKNLVQLHLRYSPIKEIWSNTKFPKMLKVLNLSYCKNLGKNPNFSRFPFLEDLRLEGCESLVEVGFDDKKFQDKLKFVDLSYCKNLKKTPNLSRLSCLETLDFKGCISLVEVHPSIEFHKRLIWLSFKKCKNLKNLPTRINLKSLKFLYLTGCSKLEKFPEFHRDMICLEDARFNGTAIKELPPSIGHLEGLIELHLWECKMLGSLSDNMFSEMKSLRKLWLNCSGIKKLPSSIAQLSILELDWGNCNLDEESILNLPHSLRKLDLRGNDFVSLRSSFSQLTDLYQLDLDDCVMLQTLESLPSSIRCLALRGCSSLQTLSLPEFTTLVLAQGCASLEGYSIRTSDGCNFNFNLTESHTLVENHGNGNKKPNIYYSQSEDIQGRDTEIFFPGSEIPSWFSHIKYESEGVDMTLVYLWIDTNSLRYLKGVSVCAVIGINDGDERPFNDNHNEENRNLFSICSTSKIVDYIIGDWINKITSDHIMFLHIPNTGWMCNSNGWCYIKASINGSYPDGQPLKVKKWGIHPVMDAQHYSEHINGPTIVFG